MTPFCSGRHTLPLLVNHTPVRLAVVTTLRGFSISLEPKIGQPPFHSKRDLIAKALDFILLMVKKHLLLYQKIAKS